MGCFYLERRALVQVFTFGAEGKRNQRNLKLIQGITAVSIRKLQYENISKIF